jgi:hypothetical protein
MDGAAEHEGCGPDGAQPRSDQPARAARRREPGRVEAHHGQDGQGLRRTVKIVELTEAGRETWRRMDETIATAPPELLQLPLEDLSALLRIAERLASAAGIDIAGPSPGAQPQGPAA